MFLKTNTAIVGSDSIFFSGFHLSCGSELDDFGNIFFSLFQLFPPVFLPKPREARAEVSVYIAQNFFLWFSLIYVLRPARVRYVDNDKIIAILLMCRAYICTVQ